jgi:hypothetical protein
MERALKHFQRVVALSAGQSQNEVEFGNIPGAVKAMNTILIGSIPAGENADISLLDGGNAVVMPIDLAVTEVQTKSSVEGARFPVSIQHPGAIKAVVTASRPLAAGEAFKVKVIVYYQDYSQEGCN